MAEAKPVPILALIVQFPNDLVYYIRKDPARPKQVVQAVARGLAGIRVRINDAGFDPKEAKCIAWTSLSQYI